MRCRTRRNAETRQLRSKRPGLAIENCYDAIAQSPEEVLACISWLQRIAAKQSRRGVDGGVNDVRGRCQEILVMTNLDLRLYSCNLELTYCDKNLVRA